MYLVCRRNHKVANEAGIMRRIKDKAREVMGAGSCKALQAVVRWEPLECFESRRDMI